MFRRGQFDFPISAKTEKGVTTQRYAVDHNDWAWETFTRLFPTIADPSCQIGPDSEIESVFKVLLCRARDAYGPTVFANPAVAITAENACQFFIQKSRAAQRAWLATTGDILGAAAIQRQMDLVSPIICQLMFTGVLIIDGKLVYPDRWPDIATKEKIQAGQELGRLTVIKRLKKGKWLCRCECGTIHSARGSHLQGGKTKSCGCWKAEIETRQKAKRNARALIHSGLLNSAPNCVAYSIGDEQIDLLPAVAGKFSDPRPENADSHRTQPVEFTGPGEPRTASKQ